VTTGDLAAVWQAVAEIGAELARDTTDRLRVDR
jgi:hypothetical protein